MIYNQTQFELISPKASDHFKKSVQSGRLSEGFAIGGAATAGLSGLTFLVSGFAILFIELSYGDSENARTVFKSSIAGFGCSIASLLTAAVCKAAQKSRAREAYSQYHTDLRTRYNIPASAIGSKPVIPSQGQPGKRRH